jgi:F0F1-type ATP synthase beta subunit
MSPIIDPLESNSAMLSPYIVDPEKDNNTHYNIRHYNIARRVRILLQNYKDVLNIIAEFGISSLIEEDKVTMARARKVLLLLGQPLHADSHVTGMPGKYVSLKETLTAFEVF